MTRILLLLAVVTVVHAFGASSYGVFEVGLPNQEYTAKGIALGGSGNAVLDESHSITNPAKMAFNTRTSFMATTVFHSTEYGSTTENTFNIPYIAMDIPAGFVGNIGIAYFQQYTSDFHSESVTGLDTFMVSFDGAYAELIPSWSITLFDRLGIGFNYHIPFGLTNILENKTDIKRETKVRYSADAQIGLIGSSIQYSGKGWSVYAGFKPEYTLDMKLKGNVGLKENDADTVGSSKHQSSKTPFSYELEQRFPLEVSLGGAYRIGSAQQLTFDGSYEQWDGITTTNPLVVSDAYKKGTTNNAYSVGLGYELKPSKRTFDFYLKRVSYRAGINYSQLYVHDAKQVIGSVGLGFPLGVRKVSLIDIAFQFGARGIGAEDPQYSEYLMGFNFTLTGFGNWGKSSRRYR